MTRKRKAIIGVVVVAIPVAVMINGALTSRYQRRLLPHLDMLTTVHFLAWYAQDHDGILPVSIDSLRSQGLVGPHPKGSAQFLKYTAGTAIHDVDRIRWVAEADLRDYQVVQDRLVNRRTSEPARLVWLDGVDSSEYNVLFFNAFLLESWKGDDPDLGTDSSGGGDEDIDQRE